MKKILSTILLTSFFLDYTLASSLTLNDLKAQQIKLLKVWYYQQPFIGQILLALKSQQAALSPPLIGKKLIPFIHYRLLSANLSYLLKKQQDQTLKLCKDINQICEDIKTLSLVP